MGCNYRPWLEVQDFSSRGVVHRSLGFKTGRVHHLFSDLEFTVFLIYDLLPCILDIREQFPLLPQEETLEIAKKLRIEHPRDPSTGYPVVMTTDFLLKVRFGRWSDFHARTVKYKDDLDDPRVKEKFRIEHCYWRRRDIDWGYVTDDLIVPVLAENAALVHPFHRLADLYPLTEKEVRKIAFYQVGRLRCEERPLQEIVTDSDQKFMLPPGKSFSVICHLIARNVWRVDLTKPITMDDRLFLL